VLQRPTTRSTSDATEGEPDGSGSPGKPDGPDDDMLLIDFR